MTNGNGNGKTSIIGTIPALISNPTSGTITAAGMTVLVAGIITPMFSGKEFDWKPTVTYGAISIALLVIGFFVVAQGAKNKQIETAQADTVKSQVELIKALTADRNQTAIETKMAADKVAVAAKVAETKTAERADVAAAKVADAVKSAKKEPKP